MTVLIDTNVILDYILKREPFSLAARDCLERLIQRNASIWLTASTITDIYYITRKTLHDGAAAKNVIAKLLSSFDIASVEKSDCVKALDNGISDYEDALAAQCAKRVKAEHIITRNTSDFLRSPVPAIAPGDFLSRFPPR